MSQTSTIVDKLLTNVLQGYVPKGFISDFVLPKLQSKQTTGKIGKRGLAHLRIENTVMGGKAGAKRIEVRQYLSDSYDIEDHGLEEVITEREYANVELPFNLDRDTSTFLQLALQLGKEKALADTLRDVAIITQTTTLAGVSQWSDYTNSDPIANALTAKETIRAAAGVVPDTLIADWLVIEKLRYHPKIVRNLGFADNRAGQLTDADLAKALGLRKILIADCMYNSAKEGQTEALASIWGKDAIFAVCPDSVGIDQKSLGYEVVYSGSPQRQVFKQPVTNPPGAQSLIVRDSYDQVITATNCAYLFKTAIA